MRIVASLNGGHLLVADVALGPLGTVSVVNPAVSSQDLVGHLRIVGVGVQGQLEPFLGFLSLPQTGAVRTVNDAAPAHAEGVGELVAVEQEGNSLTDSFELGRAEVTLEVQHAVARAVELDIVEAAGLDDVKSGVDLSTIGDGVIEVERAGLDLVSPGGVLSLHDDDLLDGRLLAFEVAGVVLVDGEGRLEGSLVILDEVVRASRDAVLTSVEASILELLLDDFRSQASQVSALAVVLELNGVAQPVLDGERHVGDVSEVEEVRDLVRNDGHGVGVLVDQADAGNGSRGLFTILLAADVGQVAGEQRVQIARSLGAGEDHRPHEVLRGDGFAVVVNQALVDLHGEGLGAVLVHDGIIAGANGRVDDVRTALIGDGDSVVIGHVADHLVGGVVGPPGARGKVATDLGRRTVDDGALFSGVLSESGGHGQNHGDRQNQREKLLHKIEPPSCNLSCGREVFRFTRSKIQNLSVLAVFTHTSNTRQVLLYRFMFPVSMSKAGANWRHSAFFMNCFSSNYAFLTGSSIKFRTNSYSMSFFHL